MCRPPQRWMLLTLGFVLVDLDPDVLDKPGLVYTSVLEASIPNDVDPSDNHDEAVSMSCPDLRIEKWLTDPKDEEGDADNNRDAVLVSIGSKVYLPLAFRNLGP
jgi:hypothetical protein